MAREADVTVNVVRSTPMARESDVTVTIYRARDGWRWRAQARNGRIIADSGEAYVSKRNAERGVFRLLYWSSLVLRVQR